MYRRLSSLMIGFLLVCQLNSQASFAQTTEERFQDLFITAGYSTAFGAALGACFLAFTSDPSSQLQYIAMGASLGFIGGSLLGSYVIFSPMFVADEPGSTVAPYNVSQNQRARFVRGMGSLPAQPQLLGKSVTRQQSPFFIQPVINYKTAQIESYIGGFRIATF